MAAIIEMMERRHHPISDVSQYLFFQFPQKRFWKTKYFFRNQKEMLKHLIKEESRKNRYNEPGWMNGICLSL